MSVAYSVGFFFIPKIEKSRRPILLYKTWPAEFPFQRDTGYYKVETHECYGSSSSSFSWWRFRRPFPFWGSVVSPAYVANRQGEHQQNSCIRRDYVRSIKLSTWKHFVVPCYGTPPLLHTHLSHNCPSRVTCVSYIFFCWRKPRAHKHTYEQRIPNNNERARPSRRPLRTNNTFWLCVQTKTVRALAITICE